MHRQYRSVIGAAVLDPDKSVGRQPVMSVYHVEMAYVIFGAEEVPYIRAA